MRWRAAWLVDQEESRSALLGVSCQAASTENRSTMTLGQVRIVYTKVDHIIRRGSSYNLDLQATS